MNRHDEYMTRRQARDLARRLARLERRQRSTAAAHADLRHSAIDGGKGLVLKDEQGQEKYRLGTDENGVTAPQYRGGPVPAQPSEPFVDVGGEVVKIQHSGLDVHEDAAPADFRRAQIHVSQDEVFEPGLSTLAGYLEEADGSFTHRLPGGEWYVGIVWETLSGKTSVMSDTVLADIPPLVDTGDLEDTLAAAEEKLNSYRDEVAAPRFQALETGLSENADSLDDARTRLSEAEQILDPLPGRVESAEQDVAAAQVEATKAAAAAVEANNRAMTRLANGNFESGLDYWDHDNVELTSTAHSGQQAAQVSGWLRPGSSFPVVPDQIWELSLYYQHDVTVTFETVDGDTRTTLSTHHLDGDSTWSDSGALRVTIPAGVDMLSFTITGTAAIVDDITLRDVTDVVRLEEAANANRQKAEQAISELAVLQLAVDGEGGLKDRLASAETVLETKANESALSELDEKLGRDLAAFEAHYTRVWRQPTPPPPGVHYAWLGEPHASPSVRLDDDGNELARNRFQGFYVGGITYSREYNAWQLGPEWGRNAGMEVPEAGDQNYVAIRAVLVDLEGADQYSLRTWRGGGEDDGQNFTIGDSRVWTYNYFVNDRFFMRGDDDVVAYFRFIVGFGETEEAALSQVEQFSDGSNESDRAHDLWYNAEGVPHEWVNGTNGEPGGWVELSDDRINQLQTDVVEAAETAYLDRLVVRDEIVTPETITNRLWADLGVFNRLQAREGWIGGTNLADGAVTAEKIHATRELITKIMGAEWAYIAQQLIVDGKILTRDLEALSAAIQSLTVTQRADIAELWAEELWTALAVIEELQAEEAWITSAMISELTAEKVTVTENFVGRVAELLHLVVDRIDANSLWADQTWQAAGHFGSEQADQSTLVDGTGLRITKHDHDNETSTDIVRLGGEGIGLVFSDEQGEVTGSLSHEGDASFRSVNADTLSLAGTPLLPPGAVEVHNNNLWEAQPKGLVCFHERDMSGVSVDHNEYGFIEVNHPVRADRVYRVTTNNFLVDGDQHHYGRFRYTLGDGTEAPHTGSPQLGNTWVINRSEAGLTQTRGDHTFTPEHDGTIRILLCVSRWTTSTTGISFNNLSSMATAQLRLEDLGPARPYTGLARNAGHGGIGTIQDPQPIGGATTTEWHAQWYQTYSHNGTRQAASNTNPGGYGSGGPTQGINPNSPAQGVWSTLLGFGEGTNGQTLQQALAGAIIHSIILEVRGGASSSTNNHTRYFFYAQPQTSAPSTYTDNMRGYALLEGSTALISVGQTRRFSVPVDVFGPLLKSGDFQTLGLFTLSTQLAYAGWLDWAGTRPKLIINYTKPD